MHGVPPTTTGEVAARVVSIIVLVLTLGVIGTIVVLHEDADSSSPTAAAGEDGPLASDSGSDSGSGSDDGATTARPTQAFPLPPGARRTRVQFPSPGEKYYVVRARLPQVKQFYDDRLPAAGYEWSSPTTTQYTGSGRVTAWHGPLYAAGDQSSLGWLDIDASSVLVDRRGVVVITVDRP
ncbi:hypothetical protein GCM10023340_44890 [Nocardioides marinquilinus]|uniref:NTF2 fold domain-containing protein n=1 Tax=Nocardioides marinquilinus TaxID=1210400 RepID=A0ABP9Q5W9_9ACTN